MSARSPLFPDGQITIQQGRVGSCYLLTTFGCLIHDPDYGLDRIKSLFTETEEGVVLRLPQNRFSTNLNQRTLNRKYHYEYDWRNQQDVFHISWAQLDNINHHRGGTQTNCLALKILEHISSYYYDFDDVVVTRNEVPASLLNHNANANRHRNATSPGFAAALFGATAYETGNIRELIAFHQANPEKPMYFGFALGEQDRHGKYHGRHAFRVESIHGEPNHEVIVLVNPWDNSEREEMAASEIERREPSCAVYMVNREKFHLQISAHRRADLQLRVLNKAFNHHMEVEQIAKYQPLITLLSHMAPRVSIDEANQMAYNLSQNGAIIDTFNALSVNRQNQLLNNLRNSDNFDVFINYFFNHIVLPNAYADKNDNASYVNRTITNFLMTSNIKMLTSAGDLRQLVKTNVITRQALLNAVSPASFLHILQSKEVGVRTDYDIVPSDVVSKLFDYLYDTNNPHKLFQAIYEMRDKNPEIAKLLAKEAINIFAQRYDKSTMVNYIAILSGYNKAMLNWTLEQTNIDLKVKTLRQHGDLLKYMPELQGDAAAVAAAVNSHPAALNNASTELQQNENLQILANLSSAAEREAFYKLIVTTRKIDASLLQAHLDVYRNPYQNNAPTAQTPLVLLDKVDPVLLNAYQQRHWQAYLPKPSVLYHYIARVGESNQELAQQLINQALTRFKRTHGSEETARMLNKLNWDNPELLEWLYQNAKINLLRNLLKTNGLLLKYHHKHPCHNVRDEFNAITQNPDALRWASIEVRNSENIQYILAGETQAIREQRYQSVLDRTLSVDPILETAYQQANGKTYMPRHYISDILRPHDYVDPALLAAYQQVHGLAYGSATSALTQFGLSRQVHSEREIVNNATELKLSL